jgi:aminopeptidase YwaD
MISEEDVSAVMNWVEDTINEFGPRVMGSEAVKQTAEKLCDDLKKKKCSAEIETFTAAPNPFLGVFKICVICYLTTNLVLFIPGGVSLVIGLILCSFAVFSLITEDVFYGEVLDKFYKKAKGYNVIGTLEPVNNIKQQILLVGHHDSAYEFSLITKNPKTYEFKLTLAALTLGILVGILIVGLGLFIKNNTVPKFISYLPYFMLVTEFNMIPLYKYRENYGVPGAGDNLIASSIALQILSIFAGKNKKDSLKNTILRLVSVDGEESGLRGSRRYVSSHLSEMQRIPTYVINLESIFKADKLRVINKDRNSQIRLDKSLTDRIQRIGTDLGYSMKTVNLPLGGGSTDAASFGEKGIPTACILAMDTNHISEFYHTQKDNIDAVEPKAVEMVLKILYSAICELDHEADENQ